VAFTEAADYDDIHDAILMEHRQERDIVYPDDCKHGDNDMCFVLPALIRYGFSI
jgi:hypothetical protein